MRRTKPAGRAAESVKKTAKTGGDCLLLFFRLSWVGGYAKMCLEKSMDGIRCTTPESWRSLGQGMVSRLPHDAERVCDTRKIYYTVIGCKKQCLLRVVRLSLRLIIYTGCKCGRILYTSFVVSHMGIGSGGAVCRR